MPNLIPGYEYDIFISYRQKDNKGERWVSEFVDALKYLELAREKDPEFALAYAGIGRVWRGLQQMSAVSVSEGAPKEDAAVTRAYKLDSTISEVHHLLGGIRT